MAKLMIIVEVDDNMACEIDQPQIQIIAGNIHLELPYVGLNVKNVFYDKKCGEFIVVIRNKHNTDIRLLAGRPGKLNEKKVTNIEICRDGGSKFIHFSKDAEKVENFVLFVPCTRSMKKPHLRNMRREEEELEVIY
jgi:hypothetical protein